MFGVVCMMLIANPQYGRTLFVQPIRQAQGWSMVEIRWAFSILIALETCLTPAGGWLVDVPGPRRGPKLTVAFGGVLVGVAWVVNAHAGSLAMLYLDAVVSGMGAGVVYATCAGDAVKGSWTGADGGAGQGP